MLTALAVSSAAFGLTHGLNILSGANPVGAVIQVFSSAFLGLFLGAVFLRTGNLWAPVLIHFVHDVIAFSSVGTTTASGMVIQGLSPDSVIDLILRVILAGYAVRYISSGAASQKTLEIWENKWHTDPIEDE